MSSAPAWRRQPAARTALAAQEAQLARHPQHSGWPTDTASPQAQHAGGARAARRDRRVDGGRWRAPRDAVARTRHASTARLRQSCAVAADASWTFDPGALALSAWRGGLRPALAPRPRQHGPRAAPVGRLLAFAGGLLALIAALVSPIDRLGEQAFAMHMVQHILLLDVVPILLIVEPDEGHPAPGHAAPAAPGARCRPARPPGRRRRPLRRRDVGLARPRPLRRRAAPPVRARPRAHVLHDRRASCTGGTCSRRSAPAHA